MSTSGITGSNIARSLLDKNGLGNISINAMPGEMTDNYNPLEKSINLSEGVINSSSIAAIGIAAHEIGHAVQDAKAYAPIKLRSSLVSVANFGSNLAFPLFFIGFIVSFGPLMDAGIILYSVALFFALLTLPVEFNASNRAVEMLNAGGYVSTEEIGMVKKVLNAAALTYVATTAMAASELIRMLIMRNSRE